MVGQVVASVETLQRLYATMLAAIAALSGLVFGFDTAVVNGGLLLLRAQFHLSDLQAELAAGALIGGHATVVSEKMAPYGWPPRNRYF
jgi:hypothetical protein